MRFLLLLSTALALDILLSLRDLWVTKNPRFLHAALTEAGHNVVYVGPLHLPPDLPPIEGPNGSSEEVTVVRSKGGDFNHLLPSSQKFYKFLRHARNTRRMKAQDTEELGPVVTTAKYGQDPLNTRFWYVNGLPEESLRTALEEILPTHLPDFTPQLLLIGPNEGLHLTPNNVEHAIENPVEVMTHDAQQRGIPTISVSTQDHSHVYYEDDIRFNVEEAKYLRRFRDNAVCKNIRFVNKRILQLVDAVAPRLAPGFALNVNFPSVNLGHTHCISHGAKGPEFSQVVNAHGSKLVDEDESEQIVVGLPHSDVSDNDDLNSLYSNRDEYNAIKKCRIAVAVNHFEMGRNLDATVLNVEELVYG